MMTRYGVPVFFLLLILVGFPCPEGIPAEGGPSATPPSTGAPLVSKGGDVKKMLLEWVAKGTAAGNSGDFYDNRDRNHSGLGTGRYPGLQAVAYTPEQLERREDYGLQRIILPHVTVGNSSTSDSPERTGSLPRTYYTSSQGLSFLMTQYVRSNIYVYPEHRDHDPGVNGQGGGYGDTYPTNTPYLIISQGSSGSDQSFLAAVLHTLAAFRPEVKQRLTEKGMLIPAVQMIMRATGRQASRPGDYLTGKAHPTVFAGENLNPPAMVRMAHDMTADSLPPIAILKVREETRPLGGRDYFEPGGKVGEALCDTPFVIARVFRGVGYHRRMIVSVSRDGDLNQRPLTFHWAILRGDPDRVGIRRLTGDGSTAVLTVSHHPKRLTPPGGGPASSRVDIGVFTHNGTYYSPPSFITFFFIDSESRTYNDQQQILEAGYGAGSPYLNVADWRRLLGQFGDGDTPFSRRFLKPAFTPDQLAVLNAAGDAYGVAHAAEEKALDASKAAETRYHDLRKRLKAATAADGPGEVATGEMNALEAALKAARDDFQENRKQLDRARKNTAAVLQKHREALGMSVQDAVMGVLEEIAGDPTFLTRHRKMLDAAYRGADPSGQKAFDGERARLAGTGVIAGIPGRAIKLKPALGFHDGTEIPTLTVFEDKMIHRLTTSALAELLLPGVLEHRPRRDFVDRRISAPRFWRDLYHYDGSGAMTGWTRYLDRRVFQFNADGLIVAEKDDRGRCIRAKKVRYVWDAAIRDAEGRITRYNSGFLEFEPTGEVVRYGYDGPHDTRGHVVSP